MSDFPDPKTIPEYSENQIEILKYQLDKKKFSNQWRNTAMLILVPVVAALIGLLVDRSITHQENTNELRVEIARFITNAETFAGVRERVGLFNYFFGSDLIHISDEEYIELVNAMIEAREQLSNPLIPALYSGQLDPAFLYVDPAGNTRVLSGPLFSAPDSLDCREMDPQGLGDRTSFAIKYKALGSPWQEAVTVLEQAFEDEDAFLDALSGIYLILCPKED